MQFLNFKHQEKEPEIDLDEKVASQMLNNIFNACSVTPNAIPFHDLKSWGNYKRTDFRICKIVSAVILTLFLLVPFFFIPNTMKMTDLPQLDGSQVRLDFVVDSLLPVFRVKAKLNGQDLPVIPVKYNHYTTDVTENGNLDVTITLINGRSTVYDLKVVSVAEDTQNPQILSSELTGDELTVFVADEGSGVNYAGVYAVNEQGERVPPISCDEAAGAIVFPYLHDNTNLFIPDNRGNTLQAVVSSTQK